MEMLELKVISCGPALDGGAVEALVFVCSARLRAGVPEVRMLIRVRMPEGAGVEDAYDLALRYLDPI